MKINNTDILVVKIIDNKLVKHKVSVLRQLRIEFQNRWIGFEKANLKYYQRVNSIGLDLALRPLLKDFDFAKSLSNAYQGIKSRDYNRMARTKEIKYHESVSQEHKDQAESKNIDKLHKEFEDRLLAFNLEIMYKGFDSSNAILTYSHRKVGWSNPLRRVDANFTFQVKTNFGYGGPSYFFTILTYKSINVVPFCEVILYRRAKVAEILLYSNKHSLDNESWSEAIDFLITASNTYLESEKTFVQKYIVDEIGRLTSTLSDILYDRVDGIEVINSKYKFLNREKEYIDLKKYSHDTTEFKGDRISESLKFIPILKQMSSYYDFSIEIGLIEKMGQDILDEMKYRLPEIDDHLSVLRRRKTIAKIKYEAAKTEKDKFLEECQIEFRKYNFNKHDKIGFTEFEKIFSNQNEDFRIAYINSTNTYKVFSEHTLEFKRFQIIKDNIERYISTINHHFN